MSADVYIRSPMTIVKLNLKKYVKTLHGRGIYGRYSQVKSQDGTGIVDSLGKNATKMLLGGIGKAGGKHLGSTIGKWIGDKTGSKLVGKIAKTAVGSLAGLAGGKAGQALGSLVGNAAFNAAPAKKAKKGEQATTLSQMLDKARAAIGSQAGNGIMLQY
jgi:hypothetical protein